MQEQTSSQIIVELLSEESQSVDPVDVALVGEVRTELFRQLEKDGFAPSLGETHQKGGDVWLQVGIGVATLAQTAWDHHHTIIEAIGDAGTLYLFFEKTAHIARHIHQAFHKKAPTSNAASKPCTITIDVDGVSMSIEAELLEQPDAAAQLVQRFARLAPEVAKQVNARSQVHLQGKLPKYQHKKHKGHR